MCVKVSIHEPRVESLALPLHLYLYLRDQISLVRTDKP
jgi:hypothetical protein